MPITRRDNSKDTIDKLKDPIDQAIVVLWNSRWIIAGVAVAAAILVYVVLLFVPSTFRVESEIYVNQLASMEDGNTPNPDTVSALLISKSVLEKVRNDYVKQFDLKKQPEIERFTKKFKVESHILQDTTVRKEFSPVLTLQVEAAGAKESQYIMTSWMKNFIKEFGNYTIEESVTKRDMYNAEKEKLQTDIDTLTRRRAVSEARLPLLKKLLAEKLDLLSPSRLRMENNNENTNNIDISIKGARMRPGLLERQAEIIVDMRSGSAGTSAVAELKAINSSIEDAKTSVAAAQKALADELAEEEISRRQLELLTLNQTAINQTLSKFVVASAAYKAVQDSGLPTGGDVRALSMPVTPEARIWPKRTSSAAIAAVVAAIIAIFVILGGKFLSGILDTKS